MTSYVVSILKFKALYLIPSLLLLNTMIWGGEVLSVQDADKLLKEHSYSEAIKLYNNLETSGKGGPDMYHNMAIANLNLGKQAEAIVYLQKGLKFRPADKSLMTLYQNILNDNAEIEPATTDIFISHFLKSTSAIFLPKTWMWMTFLPFIGIGFLLYVRYPDRLTQKSTKLYLFSFAFVFILFSSFGISRNQQIYNNKTIVVTTPNTILKVGPDHESPNLSPLAPGSIVYYKDNIQGWWLVRTSYGDEGWIEVNQGTKI